MRDYDIAQVESVYKAFAELVVPRKDGMVGTQQRFDLYLEANNANEIDVNVIGFFDRLYVDHFAENKFSSRPENYIENVFNISSQIGTYFLANPAMEYVIMEVARTPSIKLGKYEKVDEYADRLYEDVLRRPAYYFPGYSFAKKTYGVVFYRAEFERWFDEMAARYKIIAREIVERMKNDTWYRCEQCCNLYNAPCEFYRICENGQGNVSEELYVMEK